MRHGWLTTLRSDGSPRSSRVWFVERADRVWIATSESALKVADIRRDRRVSFAIEGRHGGRAGTASIESVDEHPEVLQQFRDEYDGWEAADPAAYGPRVLIEVR